MRRVGWTGSLVEKIPLKARQRTHAARFRIDWARVESTQLGGRWFDPTPVPEPPMASANTPPLSPSPEESTSALALSGA